MQKCIGLKTTYMDNSTKQSLAPDVSVVVVQTSRTYQVKPSTFLSLDIEAELINFVKYFRLDDQLTMKLLFEHYPDVARKLVEGLSSINKTQRVCM